MVYQKEITIRTRNHGEMHDLTREVNRIVADSGIRTGIVHIFNVGSTAAIGTIEFEPGLRQDLHEMLDRLIPPSTAMGTSKPGTTATAIPTYRPHFSVPR